MSPVFRRIKYVAIISYSNILINTMQEQDKINEQQGIHRKIFLIRENTAKIYLRTIDLL